MPIYQIGDTFIMFEGKKVCCKSAITEMLTMQCKATKSLKKNRRKWNA
jgi:hypothetical protein